MVPWIEEIATLLNENELRAWSACHPEHWKRESLAQLLAEVVASAHIDRDRASRLAAAARPLADLARDPYCRALALRSSAAARYAANDYAASIADFSASLRLFEQLGDEIEIGKTLNSALQALAYTGQHERALEWAARAKAIFARHRDELRLARLSSNMANILFRQDRAAEALALYEEALSQFRRTGAPADIGAALCNIAACLTTLGDFARAIAFCEEARSHSAAHGLKLLVAESDYNIAWLHYLRGDYVRAMELYSRTRAECGKAGDSYHLALCDLDESEMYLQLNLTVEGGELARRAAEAFAGLGMPYERAKALVNQAIAETRPGKAGDALLREARRLFIQEDNRVWLALIDFHEAILARRRGEGGRALRLARMARRLLSASPLAGKAILCAMLEARVMLDRGHVVRARDCSVGIAKPPEFAVARPAVSGLRASCGHRGSGRQ